MAASSEEHVSLRTWIAVLGTILGAFMAVLDIQITNASLREITGGIGSTAVEASWVSTSYLIGEIITIPLTAWLGRVFGGAPLSSGECLFVPGLFRALRNGQRTHADDLLPGAPRIHRRCDDSHVVHGD